MNKRYFRVIFNFFVLYWVQDMLLAFRFTKLNVLLLVILFWGIFFEFSENLLKFFLIKKNFITRFFAMLILSVIFLYSVDLFIPSVWIENLLIQKKTLGIIIIPHLELFGFYSIIGISLIAALFLNILYFIYKKF